MDKMVLCGVGVSAQELVVACSGKKDQAVLRRFTNSAGGHRALLRTLTRGGKRVRVVMEATGLYGLDVALLLSAHPGVQLMVANPRAVRDFAKAMMQRSKSDPLNARMLREFAACMPFQPWARPNANTLALWAIARRLQTLSKLRAAEKNRLHAASVSQAVPAPLRRSIQRMLRSFQRESEQLRAEAQRYIAADDQLQRKYQLLCSATGFAENSAIQMLGELAMLPADRDVRQWVAFAGLDPREHSSGTSVHKRPRISKMGNRHLRHVLFMPALVASRREPHLHGFYEHLLAKGKTKRLALMAVARKLLHAIYGMFRSGKPSDGTRVYQLSSSLPTPLAQRTT